MTPKEKAKQLVDMFKPYMYPFGPGSAYLTGDRVGNNVLGGAKKCAISLADEIIPLLPRALPNETVSVYNDDYWISVKEEIQKL